MRVLVLVDRLGLGGAERAAVSLATGLRKRGVDARLGYLANRRGNPLLVQLRASRTPAFDLHLRTLRDPRPILRLALYLRRERIDLVHTHLRCSNIIGRAAAALARRPVVSTIHNSVEGFQQTPPGWRQAARRQLDYSTARALCSRLITVSEAQREVYMRAARMAPGKVETHLNGIDTRIFRPNPTLRTRLRADLGIPAEALLFVTVAGLHAYKGTRYFLEAAALLRTRAPQMRLAIVGDGVEREALEARSRALCLGSTVQFLGRREDVPALLAASDIYVHPSLMEALPTAVLEAMAVGLPVVATRVGGLAEMVAHGRTGLLVPPARADELAEAMGQLLEPSQRQTMGSAGRAWVEQHGSRQVWLDQMLRVYRAVLS